MTDKQQQQQTTRIWRFECETCGSGPGSWGAEKCNKHPRYSEGMSNAVFNIMPPPRHAINDPSYHCGYSSLRKIRKRTTELDGGTLLSHLVQGYALRAYDAPSCSVHMLREGQVTFPKPAATLVYSLSGRAPERA